MATAAIRPATAPATGSINPEGPSGSQAGGLGADGTALARRCALTCERAARGVDGCIRRGVSTWFDGDAGAFHWAAAGTASSASKAAADPIPRHRRLKSNKFGTMIHTSIHTSGGAPARPDGSGYTTDSKRTLPPSGRTHMGELTEVTRFPSAQAKARRQPVIAAILGDARRRAGGKRPNGARERSGPPCAG